MSQRKGRMSALTEEEGQQEGNQDEWNQDMEWYGDEWYTDDYDWSQNWIGSLDDWSGDWSWSEDDWYWSDDWSWVLRNGGVLNSRVLPHCQACKALQMSCRTLSRVSLPRMWRP